MHDFWAVCQYVDEEKVVDTTLAATTAEKCCENDDDEQQSDAQTRSEHTTFEPFKQLEDAPNTT